MDFSNHLNQYFQEIDSRLWVQESKALALLIALGQFDYGKSWVLFREYRQWGLLHLLILSGSQFYAFAVSWEKLIVFLQRIFCKTPSLLWARISTIPAGIYYLLALNMPAPLVRCALLWLLFALCGQTQKNTFFLWALAFVFQITFFEKLAPTNSAFLSWLAFLMLFFTQKIFPKSLHQAIFMTCILQLSITFLKDQTFNLWMLLIAILANIVALPIYNKLVFPVIGLLSATSLLFGTLLSPFFNPLWSHFFAPSLSILLEIALWPVLVVNGVFRYTLN